MIKGLLTRLQPVLCSEVITKVNISFLNAQLYSSLMTSKLPTSTITESSLNNSTNRYEMNAQNAAVILFPLFLIALALAVPTTADTLLSAPVMGTAKRHTSYPSGYLDYGVVNASRIGVGLDIWQKIVFVCVLLGSIVFSF